MNAVCDIITHCIPDLVDCSVSQDGMCTIELSPHTILQSARLLREQPELSFELLLDVCGVDYLEYGMSEWRTTETTGTGFSRAASKEMMSNNPRRVRSRFAVVYHFLSTTHNHRIRVRSFLSDHHLSMQSISSVFTSADWYEREVYDLYGIYFSDHPNLKRLLTDYGFDGHPFRKDFPLIGRTELKYDAQTASCVYEPVQIEARTTVPKVIRHLTEQV